MTATHCHPWHMNKFLFLVPLLLIAGCTGGKPLHQFAFNESLDPQTTTLILEKGEKLSFWNSLNVAYKLPITIDFFITIKTGKEPVTMIVCDALHPTLTFMSSTTEREDSVEKSWKTARMKCEFGPIEEKMKVTITSAPQVGGTGTVQVKQLILELKN